MTATEQADRILIEAMMADDGCGYPERASFIASDIHNWESIA